ncbi:MAG: sulfatase [Deltaproteobacteria bacterium]
MGFVGRVYVGALGGAAGGALAGFAEGALIAATGGGVEAWVLVLGPLYYAVFGAMAGAGWGFAASVLPVSKQPEAVGPVAGGLAVAFLVAVVGRFRIVRDVFAESLPLGSPTGLLVHAGIVGLAAVVCWLFVRSMRPAVAKRGMVGAALARLGGVFAVGLVLAVGLGLARGGDQASTRTPNAQGPNAILIIVDTLRADHTGPYGSKDVSTPALDALAADGVVFDTALAQSSWTRPSIATILTSLYASSHQVMHKTDLLPDGVDTVAEVMAGQGYRTAGFVTNINVSPAFNFAQGFDSYTYLAPEFFFFATDSASKLALYSGMRLVRERFLSRKKYVQHYYQDADTVNAMVLPWLGENAQDPFFALVHYMDPHDPYLEVPYNGYAVARVNTPHPQAQQAGELRRLYIANIEYLDGFIGRLVAQLKEAGVYDNTVIVFTSDHGEEFYEHQGWWHGTTLYEEQVRVPLIVKLPGNRFSSTHRKDLARLLDVAPTLVAAIGVAPAASWQGRDLFSDLPRPQAVYAEEDHEGNVLEALHSGRWKLILANQDNPRGLSAVELYDLQADPGELHNLAGSHSDLVASLRVDLEDLRALAGAGAVEGLSGEIDEASRERLRALGYIQ